MKDGVTLRRGWRRALVPPRSDPGGPSSPAVLMSGGGQGRAGQGRAGQAGASQHCGGAEICSCIDKGLDWEKEEGRDKEIKIVERKKFETKESYEL